MKRFCHLIICFLLISTIPLTAYAEDYVPNNGDAACSHVFSAWQQVENGHTRACTLCGLTELAGHSSSSEGTVTVPSTCTEDGIRTHVCGECGASFQTPIRALGHEYTYQNVDASSHKRICKNCGGEEIIGHEWRDKGWNSAPTCISEGSVAFDCACGATKTEPLAMTDHSFSPWSGDELTHTRSCSYCGKAESGAHSWYGGTVILAPTCNEVGVMGYLCGGCDMVLLEEIPMRTAHIYDNDCDADCNSCGEKRNAGHTYGTTYAKNATGHWYACIVCGSKKDSAPHIPGPAATENSEQTCTACGYVLTSRLNHTHDYQKAWTSDEEGHWYACTGCEVQKDFKAHTYDDGCDADCNVCGYITKTAHTYDGTWQTDEAGHWSICTVCNAESTHEAHIPGPEATETDPQICTTCSYLLAPVQEHKHSGGDIWLNDRDKHWKTCECGEITDEAIHVWGDGIENEDSTVTYTCSDCNAIKTEGTPTEATTEPDMLEEPQKGSPTMLLVFFLVIAALLGAIIALILVLKPNKRGRFTR